MPEKRTPHDKVQVLQLCVTLKKVSPPVWRRLVVPSFMSLADLHDLIQISMGWNDQHQYQFQVDDQIYAEPEFDVDDPFGMIRDAWDFCLAQVRSGQVFGYLYDFNEKWEHEIRMEGTSLPVEGFMYPACVGGERACPPEGLGGAANYEEMVRALADLNNEKRLQFLKWMGGVFDPEGMDVNRINAEIWSYDWAGDRATH